jgi:DNA-binding transcriptional regulator YbjK
MSSDEAVRSALAKAAKTSITYAGFELLTPEAISKTAKLPIGSFN